MSKSIKPDISIYNNKVFIKFSVGIPLKFKNLLKENIKNYIYSYNNSMLLDNIKQRTELLIDDLLKHGKISRYNDYIYFHGGNFKTGEIVSIYGPDPSLSIYAIDSFNNMNIATMKHGEKVVYIGMPLQQAQEGEVCILCKDKVLTITSIAYLDVLS